MKTREPSRLFLMLFYREQLLRLAEFLDTDGNRPIGDALREIVRRAEKSGICNDICKSMHFCNKKAGCDSCAGRGGDPDCMCGGTGRATDAVIYLRDRLQEATAVLEYYGAPETYEPGEGHGYMTLYQILIDEDGSHIDGVLRPGRRARDFLGWE